MTLSRRSFLTGLGLGGIVVATPFAAKAFLDVGLATRQGKRLFKLEAEIDRLEAELYLGLAELRKPWADEITQEEYSRRAHERNMAVHREAIPTGMAELRKPWLERSRPVIMGEDFETFEDVSQIPDLKEDGGSLWVGSGDPRRAQFYGADLETVSSHDIYIDRTNGQIWSVNPATGEARLEHGTISASLRKPLMSMSPRQLDHALEELAKPG